jgi:hypothetical protein
MSKGWRRHSTVETYVETTPDTVYDLIADVTRSGVRSTECVACTWLPGHEPGRGGSLPRGQPSLGSRALEPYLRGTGRRPGPEVHLPHRASPLGLQQA